MKNKDLFANLTLNQTVKFIHMMVSVPKTTASNNEGDLFVVKKKKNTEMQESMARVDPQLKQHKEVATRRQNDGESYSSACVWTVKSPVSLRPPESTERKVGQATGTSGKEMRFSFQNLVSVVRVPLVQTKQGEINFTDTQSSEILGEVLVCSLRTGQKNCYIPAASIPPLFDVLFLSKRTVPCSVPHHHLHHPVHHIPASLFEFISVCP